MESEIINAQLSACILRVLQLKEFELRRNMRAFEVPGWDSLSHAELIVAVEKEFDVEFTTREVLELQSLGDLEHLVERAAERRRSRS